MAGTFLAHDAAARADAVDSEYLYADIGGKAVLSRGTGGAVGGGVQLRDGKIHPGELMGRNMVHNPIEKEHPHAKRLALTLIECLVILAIVAVVLAFVLPAVNPDNTLPATWLVTEEMMSSTEAQGPV